MNPTEQLRDIYGLEPVSWWPLAPGGWLILGITLLFLVLLLGFLIYRHFSKRSKPRLDWRQVALAEWTALTADSVTPREQVVQLAMLLRRVAMQRYGRKTCAGLSGEQWLLWSNSRDR